MAPRTLTPSAPDAPPRLDRLWTIEQAAAYLVVSPRYLRDTDCPRLRLPGRGPRRQALLRFEPEAVRAWAQRFRTDAPDDAHRRAA